jgi:hypothetical protein
MNSSPFSRFYLCRLFWGLWLCGALAACRGSDPETDLRADFRAHLAQLEGSYQTAAALWDQVLIGGGASCLNGLPLPPDFQLSQSQADAYPPSLALREALNQAGGLLAQVGQLWDQACGGGEVSAQMARQAYQSLLAARAALDLAQAQLSAW